MKKERFTSLRKLVLFLFFSLASLTSAADESYDSLQISLLTCAPHEQIYSLYGHTAIRLKDTSQGYDIVVNYGLFDSSAKFFVLRFVFGLTDYSMGISPFELFKQEYAYYGSEVVQQQLNLTPEEKSNIMEAIRINALPENLIYRYNYFYDNCTTRARDMLVNHLSGEVQYLSDIDEKVTFRQMVHSCNVGHPWAMFGNDMLLGVQADLPTSRQEQQFLPKNLKRDFSNAEIVGKDGSRRRLISEESVVIPSGEQTAGGGFPLTPTACALILLAIAGVLTLIEMVKKTDFWCFDVFLMISTGLAGILLFLMLFSVHPTVRINLQLLLLNPLPLFFVYPVLKSIRRHQPHQWWKIWIILLILFLAGRFFQHYAEGTLILALTLLMRCISRIYRTKMLKHQ